MPTQRVKPEVTLPDSQPMLDLSHEAELRKAQDRIRYLEGLFFFLAPLITVRNGNGALSRQFCSLCQAARSHRVACRHAEIFRIADKVEAAARAAREAS